MLCEKCKKRTATVFYNENINGKMRSYSFCGECAAKLKEKGEIQDITSMIGSFADPFAELHDNLFGGFFGMPTLRSVSSEKKCPICASAYSDIIKEGRVGCPECYLAFSDELTPTIRSVHGTTMHTGAVPSRYRAQKARAEQLKRLKKELQDSISREDFERAAALRDEIKKLDAQNGKKEEA